MARSTVAVAAGAAVVGVIVGVVFVPALVLASLLGAEHRQ